MNTTKKFIQSDSAFDWTVDENCSFEVELSERETKKRESQIYKKQAESLL